MSHPLSGQPEICLNESVSQVGTFALNNENDEEDQDLVKWSWSGARQRRSFIKYKIT